MSRDVYEKLDMQLASHRFYYQCAPVVSRCKPANLLIIPPGQMEQARRLVRLCGLSYFRLYASAEKIILFVYDPALLAGCLARPAHRRFFQRRGYGALRLGPLLLEVAARYRRCLEEQGEFPHELGLLLGYPLRDVEGYMRHGGKDYLLSGYWKVYGRAEEARRTFRRYDLVTEELLRKLLQGKLAS